MKILLAIFCGLVALFAGGCALILVSGAGYQGMFQSLPLAAIPGGVALLNVLVLLALFGSRNPQSWAFYVLAGLDGLIALVIAALWIASGFADSSMNLLAMIWLVLVMLKALLTLLAVRSLRGTA